jgi:sodium-coupled neutral amino acid transporter 11
MASVVATASGINLGQNMWVTRVTLISLALGAVLPLALLKDMSKLSKTSFLSLASVVVILLVVFTRFVTGPCPGNAGSCDVPQPGVTSSLPGVPASPPSDTILWVVGSKFLPAVGVIAFAFICHHACFIVFNTLRDNTEERWARTVHLTLGTASSVMVLLSIFAFLTFRGVMSGSFLTNYSYVDGLSNFMRCLFALAQTLTYPIELFVARHAIHAIMFPAQRWTDQQHYVITGLLWGSSVAIALNVTDLGAVLELTGGVAAVSIGFVLPPILHFKMTPEFKWRFWQNKGAKKWAALRAFWPSYFVLALGLCAMFVTIGTMISELSHGGAHGAIATDAFDANIKYDAHGNRIVDANGAQQSGGAGLFDLPKYVLRMLVR